MNKKRKLSVEERINQLPKKLFCIENLTFILPDNFEGNVQDALKLFTDYLAAESKDDPRLLKGNEPRKNILELKEDANRVSLQYGIFELDENGNYVLT